MTDQAALPSITSPTNARLKAVAALRRRRERERTGSTLVEGYAELALAVAAGARAQELLVCRELMSDPASQWALVERLQDDGARVSTLSRAAFEKVAYREGADGFLAVTPSVGSAIGTLRLHADSLVLACERIEKPGNLGAMLRTADAAGVDAVVALDPVTDWGNPNVVRASKGTLFTRPVHSGRPAELLERCRAAGTQVVAATPDTDTEYTDVDLRPATVVLVGAEQQGLSAGLLDAADMRVRIPMRGRVDSLNVATSAALLLYEALRQRRSASATPP